MSVPSSEASSSSTPSSSFSQHLLLQDWEISVPYDPPILHSMDSIRRALMDPQDEDEEEDKKDGNSEAESGMTDDDDPTIERQVFYHEGATPLFSAIEEGNWKLALRLAHESPRQLRTWVKSTGTVATTFSWSVWRRLPLHEACRRQAPAWLVAEFLSSFPASASKTTHFGQRPLHLAVESGAAPEVVNLLLAADYTGIVATDQSGRTPLDILEEAELLERQDQTVILESLTRTLNTYQAVMASHQCEISQLQQEGVDRLKTVSTQHEADLKVEQDQQNRLEEEVMRLSKIVSELATISTEQSTRIEDFDRIEATRQTETFELVAELKHSKDELNDAHRLVDALQQLLSIKDDEIAGLKDCVGQLSVDLKACHAFQTQMKPHMAKTNIHLRQAASCFLKLCQEMETHSGDLTKLLDERGIESIESYRDDGVEEKKDDQNVEEYYAGCEDRSMSLTHLEESTIEYEDSPCTPLPVQSSPCKRADRPYEEDDDEVTFFIHSLENEEEVPTDISGSAVAAAAMALGALHVEK